MQGETMALYSASIKYKYGSGKTTLSTSQLKRQSESTVIAFLKEKHESTKNLEILIEKIDWE
jgi:hypothetical protein